MMRRILFICCVLCFCTRCGYAIGQQRDIDLLCERLSDKYLSEVPDVSQADKDMETMQVDGSWNDIDYKTVTFYFDAERHLDRLRNMALAYSKGNSRLYHEPRLKEKIVLGLDYFRLVNPSSENWWHRDIGAPSGYMVPLLLMKKAMKRETVMRLSAYLVDKTDNMAHKGKNRTWVSAVLVHKGCIEDNYDLIAKGFSSIASTIYVEEKDDEGMKRDYSIHQHRPQLYSGGYGMSLMSDLAEYISWAEGTSFMKNFTTDKIGLVSDIFLKGMRMFGYRESFDFGTIGRGICRPNCLSNVSPRTLDLMKKIDIAHADDYEVWKKHIMGAAFPVRNNTHFWKSNIMTHHGDNYYMSSKVISVRTNGTEMLNGQNLKGYYLPLGATNIMTDGHEYDDVFVAWDWTRIPGTTAIANQATTELRWYLFGSNQFGGGVSNGHNGVMAYEHAYQGVEAKKAYFFIGDAMVCMGSGIKAARTQEVRTSVNQCLACGEVTYGLAGRPHSLAEKLSSKEIEWVYHNNVGYIFPYSKDVTLKQEVQMGSWRDIEVTGSEEPVAKDMFSLWISHGTTPDNDDYCYIVMPDRPLSYFMKRDFDKEIKIIANTKEVQAVSDGKQNQFAVVFYEPCEIELTNDLVLTANEEVLVYMVKRGNQYEIAVSDPLYQKSSVRLKINRVLEGEGVSIQDGCSLVDIRFPTGDYQGSSTIRMFEEVTM